MIYENLEVSSFILHSYMHLLNGNNESVEIIGTEDLKIPSFSEEILIELCNHAIDILKQTNKTLIYITSPSIVVGDLHGNLHDLIRILNSIIDIFSNRILFLGDYVDRGQFQIETITLLLALRIEYPDNIFLIRGNHEFTDVNALGGFKKEILQSGYSEALFEKFNEVFYWLPISAVINDHIFCVHGGLSPFFTKISQINTEFRLPIKNLISNKITKKRRLSCTPVAKSIPISNPTFSESTEDTSIPIPSSAPNSAHTTDSSLTHDTGSTIPPQLTKHEQPNRNSSPNISNIITQKLPPICPSNSPIPKPLNFPVHSMNSSPIPPHNHHSILPLGPKSLHVKLHLSTSSSFTSNNDHQINLLHIEAAQSNMTKKEIDQFNERDSENNENEDQENSFINNTELLTDLLWSDPTNSCDSFIPSNRGSGCYFGFISSNNFLNNNGMKMIVRGHESILKGVETTHEKKVVTVFSSSSIKLGGLCGCIMFDTNDKYKSFMFNPLKIVRRKEAIFFTPVFKQTHTIESLSHNSMQKNSNGIHSLQKIHKGLRSSLPHFANLNHKINVH